MMPEVDILKIILASAISLQKIHAKKLVHNDVHEGNVIFDDSTYDANWIDFAFAIELPENVLCRTIELNNKVVPKHKAPESNIQRGYATDIYQLGFMAARMLLVLGLDDCEEREKLIDSYDYSADRVRQNAEHNIPPLFYQMMAENWEDRPTIAEVIEDGQVIIDNLTSCQAFTPVNSGARLPKYTA
jgi:serine/threonine protein kinase